ncbi:hypothetical protein WCN91_13005 [Pseudoalteromonas sp. YIC-827]|uniref:Uncharacterized protein n=1 Tax=Pseudoalteromonas qingdaonensis TaxID=3131913 RepID=A0ABU9N227_9GAMM
MGFFSSIKQGAFLTQCKVACLKHGFEKASAELYVDMGAEMLLDCYNNNLKPEAALGVLSVMVLKDKSGVPMQMLGAADRYARSFINSYPYEAMTSQLRDALAVAKNA